MRAFQRQNQAWSGRPSPGEFPTPSLAAHVMHGHWAPEGELPHLRMPECEVRE